MVTDSMGTHFDISTFFACCVMIFNSFIGFYNLKTVSECPASD